VGDAGDGDRFSIWRESNYALWCSVDVLHALFSENLFFRFNAELASSRLALSPSTLLST
jgi:hypothetical protein